ncbi:MAG TPA: glycosyltransferase [Gemmatimonadaceae bacterium]|jgi:glycosyltransferase involved in cell wall biosynthesis
MSAVPCITVLMSVYNDERYVAAAVQSILAQTFQDFELLVIDDGSTDSSRSVIEAFDDSRIRIVSRENRGLTASLNEGLLLARGRYIARQDSDDISLPLRLEREFALLESHADVGLVGTNYTIIDEQARAIVTTSVFTHPHDLAIAEIVSNQYGHGSVMFRKAVLQEVGGYDPSVGHVEDYDLFVRIGRVAKLANIPEPLYLWRRNPDGVTFSNREEQISQAFAVRDREFDRILTERDRFRLYSSFHPFDFHPSPRAYLEKKATLFRDLSYLYRARSMRREALIAMCAAMFVAPWVLTSFHRMFALLKDRSSEPLWEFEWL